MSGFVEAGAPPQKLSDGNYIMTYNLVGGCNCWGAGYLILDAKDPTIILQRSTVHEGGPLLWPEEPWEVTNTTATSWQPLKCCIGATNSLQPLGGDRFLAHYASGDSVAGGAIITVATKTDDDSQMTSADRNTSFPMDRNYHPNGSQIEISNSGRFFNRPLYGVSNGLVVFGGDRPLVKSGCSGMFQGTLMVALRRGDQSGGWAHLDPAATTMALVF